MQHATRKQTIGSAFADELSISYEALVEALGEPHDCSKEGEWESGDGKVRAEWAFIFPELDDTVLTIYDYKSNLSIKEVTDWHIGAKGRKDNIDKAISQMIEQIADRQIKKAEHENINATMTPEHKQFLNELRESGVTNMFGAGPYLEKEFGLTKKDALSILSEWMRTFKQND